VIDLAFGNSVAVRQAFLDVSSGQWVVFGKNTLINFDYQERTGDTELVEMTKKVIKRQTGTDYKYVVLTNGATGGIVISLRMFAQKGYEFCNTRKAPYYLRYPGMIAASGLHHCDETFCLFEGENVILQDIPSNPLSILSPIRGQDSNIPVVLDAVYMNKVYMQHPINMSKHDMLVGSYSKLLGLSSLRIGWIATNDPLHYERLKELVTAEYCCLSKADTEIAKSIMAKLDWDKFETVARSRLDGNREEWSKVAKYFGDTPVSNIGMFYYGPMDKKCKKLLEKCEIKWTTGSSLGTNDDFGRINIGQDPALIQKAVKVILRTDKSKK
jgi:aspartate/methionine/tyrosine aminotransferase